jgi:hypothetical protein
MAGTGTVGAAVPLLATGIEAGRDLSSVSGILADSLIVRCRPDGPASVQVPDDDTASSATGPVSSATSRSGSATVTVAAG